MFKLEKFAMAGKENPVESMVNSLNELSHQETPDDYKIFLKPWNPDDIWQKTGDYSVYENMGMDDQVSISMQMKKDLVIGDGIEFVAQDEDQEDIIDDLTRVIEEDYNGEFLCSVEEMLDAYDKGFSLTEKVYKYRADNSLTLKYLKTRHPNTWKIYTDEKGNIEKYTQENTKEGLVTIKPQDNKLIHYINRGQYQNPYGLSDLRSAYEAWFTKKQVIKYWAIFLERVASPKAVGRYPQNAPADFKNGLLTILKKFQAKTSMVMPKEAEVEFLEAKSNGEAYKKAIDYLNMMIGRTLFIPDLAGFQGSETAGGSFSLGSEQIAVQLKHLSKRKAILENILNKEVFKQIIFYNHGLVENPPRLQFKPISDNVAVEYAKLWLEAVKGRAYKPSDNEINHFRNIVKFPEGEVDRIENPAPQNIRNPLGKKNGEPQKRAGQIDKEIGDKEAEEFSFKKPEVDHGKNVDFKSIRKFMDGQGEKIMAEGNILIDQIYEDLLDQIAKKKILDKKDPSLMEKVKVKKLKDIKQLLNRYLKDANKFGQTLARQEILGQRNFADPILAEEFLKILDQENFNFVGDWEFQLSKGARVAVVQAIKDGKPISSVIEFLDEDKKRAQVSLERYARTKTTEVFNKGRLEFFNGIEFIWGYQYSAILDGRTTPICAGLHGKRFKKGTEPVPPMHFNCRSVLVPITRFENPEADKRVGGEVSTAGKEKIKIPNMDINKFIEQEKGKGFPSK